MNVDGAFNDKMNEGGIGVVIRDAARKALLTSWCFVRNARDAEEVEAMAVREGVRLAAECGVGGYPW